MADKRISELNALTATANTDLTLVEPGEHNYNRGDNLKVEPETKSIHAFDKGGKAIRK